MYSFFSFPTAPLSQLMFHSGFLTGLPTIHLCSFPAFFPHYSESDIFRLTSTSSEPQVETPSIAFIALSTKTKILIMTSKALCVLAPLLQTICYYYPLLWEEEIPSINTASSLPSLLLANSFPLSLYLKCHFLKKSS